MNGLRIGDKLNLNLSTGDELVKPLCDVGHSATGGK